MGCLIGLCLCLLSAAPRATVDVDALPEEYREKARTILAEPSLVSNLPRTRVAANDKVMGYLLDHLPLCAVMGRNLGWSHYLLDELPDGALHLDDREGLEATMTEVARSDSGRTYLVHGYYRLSVFRIWSDGLIRLEWRNTPDGAMVMWAKVWLRFEDGVVHRVSRAMRGVLGKIIRRKATVFIDTATRLSVAVAANPEDVYQRAMEGAGNISDPEREDFRTRFSTPEEGSPEPASTGAKTGG